jgi:hypothetical protein
VDEADIRGAVQRLHGTDGASVGEPVQVVDTGRGAA